MGILLFVFSMIAFAIFGQARKMISTKKRQILATQRRHIEDTEMVLKYAISLALSPRLTILLHQRIITALKKILAVEPFNEKLKHHIEQQNVYIANAKLTSPTSAFIEPVDERIAIDLARSISRLKVILRHELYKMNISPDDCRAEEAKLEQIRLKLRLSNCLNKAAIFFKQEKYNTTAKMLTDSLALLASIEIKDEYLTDKFNQMTALLNKANFEISLIETQKEPDEKTTENLTSLDTLFDQKQPK